MTDGSQDSAAEQLSRGLAGVIAGESAICFIDGETGRLAYRGYDIRALASGAGFEEIAHLLWHGELPDSSGLQALKDSLAAERELPTEILGLIRYAPRDRQPMEVLRSVVSALSLGDAEAEDPARAANLRKAVRLTARIAGATAAIHRLRNGLKPVAPRADLSHAGNVLYGVAGEIPDARRERLFDTALVLHADHGFNASTFAARVTAATLSDMYSAVTSAIGTLKGPLHGGANQRVMEMLVEIGEPERAAEHVRAALSRRERIFGFGHRVYRTEDPRAGILRELSREAGELAGDPRWYEISLAVERAVREQKGLYPNVDFYSASFYHALGLPTDLFVPVFAISRVAGWTAHLLEQYADNRLIRPRSRYTGVGFGRSFLPLSER